MRGLTKLFVALVVLLAVLSVAAQPWGARPTIHLGHEPRDDPTAPLIISYAIDPTRSAKMVRFVEVPVKTFGGGDIFIQLVSDGTVDNAPSAHGLFDHIRSELSVRGMSNPVQEVSKVQTWELLNGSTDKVLIIPDLPFQGSAFASSAWSWVVRGGTLICIGNGSVPFTVQAQGGSYLGALRLSYENVSGPVYPGPASEVASALGLRNIAPLTGLGLAEVEEQGGTSIGYHYGSESGTPLTTAGLFELGEGRLVAMGGPIWTPFLATAEDAVAFDIVTLLYSGAVWMDGPISFRDVPAGAEGVEGNYTIAGPSTGKMVVTAYSIKDHQSLFGRELVSLG